MQLAFVFALFVGVASALSSCSNSSDTLAAARLRAPHDPARLVVMNAAPADGLLAEPGRAAIAERDAEV